MSLMFLVILLGQEIISSNVKFLVGRKIYIIQNLYQNKIIMSFQIILKLQKNKLNLDNIEKIQKLERKRRKKNFKYNRKDIYPNIINILIKLPVPVVTDKYR